MASGNFSINKLPGYNDTLDNGNTDYTTIFFNNPDEYTTLDGRNITRSLNTQIQIYNLLVIFVGLVIMAANLFVVVSSCVLVRRGQQPRCTYLLLGNVSMGDFCMALSLLIARVYPTFFWGWNHTSCLLSLGLLTGSILVSIYSVAFIALDRYFYILHGIKYNQLVNSTRVRCMIGLSWLMGITAFVLVTQYSGESSNGTICYLVMVATPKLLVMIACGIVIPVIFVIMLYSVILCKALGKIIQIRKMEKNPEMCPDIAENPTKLRFSRGGKKIRDDVKPNSKNAYDMEHPSDRPKSRRTIFKMVLSNLSSNKSLHTLSTAPTKWKAIKVVLFTTGGFTTTWMPFFISSIVFVLCDSEKTPARCEYIRLKIASPLALFAGLNSLLNPIIYAWWHNGYREAIIKIYQKKKMTLMWRFKKPSKRDNNNS